MEENDHPGDDTLQSTTGDDEEQAALQGFSDAVCVVDPVQEEGKEIEVLNPLSPGGGGPKEPQLSQLLNALK